MISGKGKQQLPRKLLDSLGSAELARLTAALPPFIPPLAGEMKGVKSGGRREAQAGNKKDSVQHDK